MAEATIPFEICRLRVTRLDDVGNVAAGPNNYWVTDKVDQLVQTPDIETGDDKVKKGGCGCITAAAKIPDLRKRWTIAITKGSIEPGLEELMLGDAVILASGTPIGVWSTPQIGCSTPGPPNVAVEAWMKNYLFDHPDPTRPWIHVVYPSSFWQRDAETFSDDFADSPVSGFTRVNPLWGHGPYSDQPEAVPSGADRGIWFTASNPPAVTNGYATIAPSS